MPSDMQAPVYLVPTQVGDLGLELFHVHKATRSWVEPLAARRLPVCPCDFHRLLHLPRKETTLDQHCHINPVAQAPWWWATSLGGPGGLCAIAPDSCTPVPTVYTRSTCGLLWNKNFATHSNTRSIAMAVPTLTRPFLLLHLSGAHYTRYKNLDLYLSTTTYNEQCVCRLSLSRLLILLHTKQTDAPSKGSKTGSR